MRPRTIVFTLLTLFLAALALPAQELGASSSPAPTPKDLQEILSAQRELLDRQEKELQRQSALISKQQEDLDSQRQALLVMQTQVDQLSLTHPEAPALTPEQVASREKLVQPETPGVEQPENPANVLREGDFPGSIHLPGTNLNARMGGFVRVSAVNSLDPIGSDDRFVVGSIPPEGEAIAGDEPRSTISAKRSRLNMDVRMDSSVGQFRAFIEGDFAGDGGTENFRLRHAYGQYNRLLVGQTSTTFGDMQASPEELDFEGLSAQINVRHPVMRWAGLKLIGQNFGFALEDPTPSFTGGDGVSVFADLAANTNWNRERRRMQLGLLLRTLSGKPQLEDGTEGDEDTAYGYGLSLSGVVKTGRRNDTDNMMFQLNIGNGIGNYINDLRSVGGQDGVFHPDTGKLELLPTIATYVAYQRWWRPIESQFFKSLRSTLVYSYVYVDNYDYQDGGDYKATQRVSANLMFSPISSLDLGAEVIWGVRRNKDSSQGEALQWQLVATFRF